MLVLQLKIRLRTCVANQCCNVRTQCVVEANGEESCKMMQRHIKQDSRYHSAVVGQGMFYE